MSGAAEAGGDVPSAILAGITATTVMTFVLLAAETVVAGYEIRIFSAVAELFAVAGSRTVNVAVYFLMFAVVGGLLFVVFTTYLPGRTGTKHGVAFGLALWAGYLAVALFVEPRATTADPVADLVFLVVTFVAHLAYGYTLGTVYDSLSGRTASANA